MAALATYFRSAPAEDAAWALHLLGGNTCIRAVPSSRLKRWAAREAALPEWLVAECHDEVGDLAETLALLAPHPGPGTTESLSELIRNRVLPLERLAEEPQRQSIVATWQVLDRAQCLLFHKLISGTFRVGVQRRTVIAALAEVTALPTATIAHRLMAFTGPSAAAYEQVVSSGLSQPGAFQPYPFYLASPLDAPLENLGDVADWQIEWKWDGIRAQLIRREEGVFLWSRGEELVNAQFSEIAAAAAALPPDLVLDGELIAWEGGRVLPFHVLQRRLNRKRVEPALFPDVPVVFMAFDLLHASNRDLRAEPLERRRRELEQLLAAFPVPELRLSPVMDCRNWDEARRLKAQAAEARTEGLMLKRRDAPYEVGRKRGAWWKLKREPRTIDAVLVAAQRGHGRRASLYTDYTFAVWHEGELVTIAKAYSGLTDMEIAEVDRFIRRHTRGRIGPVRLVSPELVFELAFDRLQTSKRHKAGIALRFPRIARRRPDKPAREADTLAYVQALLRAQDAEGP